jgi:hypothetical protein
VPIEGHRSALTGWLAWCVLDEYRGCGEVWDLRRVRHVQPLYLRKGKSGIGALGDWGTFPISTAASEPASGDAALDAARPSD